MPIRIEHRFVIRLLPGEATEKINVIIIGTFNPAPPVTHLLTEEERKEFAKIEKTLSYIRLNQVRNFYDRPQNRFWKIMDRIHNATFYEDNHITTKNSNGLKYYTDMNRDSVFVRQQTFLPGQGNFYYGRCL